MRTPKEIQADLDRLELEYTRASDALGLELSKAMLGVDVGDTITNGNQSLVIESVTPKFIIGTMTHTDYELRPEQLTQWKKARRRG